MRLLSLSLFSLLALAIIFGAAMEYGRTLAFREMRIQTLVDIEVANQHHDKRLREYLKSRYYYYSNRAWIRLRRQEGDFGYVDENELQGFSAGKGPTTFKQEYEQYRQHLP